MPRTYEQLLAALKDISKEQIRQAGQRYTPGIDPQAPNLIIEELFMAIENVACGAGAQARFQNVLSELTDEWDRAKHCCKGRDSIQARIDDAQSFLVPMMLRLRSRDTSVIEEWLAQLEGIEADLSSDMEYWRSEEERLSPPSGKYTYSSESQTARGNVNDIGRCLAVVRNEQEYTGSASFKVLCDPQLLISGAWGTGKTHLLCDVTQNRIARDQATILVLAKNFQGQAITEICGLIEANRTVEEIFDQLQEVSETLGERSIVIIDGVNEGLRREWQKTVSTLRQLVSNRPGIGLVITCRTPFEPIAIAQEDLNSLHRVTHYGFDDQEFDAQAAFFQYYNLSLPEVPLLDKEFSRPLTLKLICQSLQNLSGSKLAKGFSGIASGQKGMTYVLESFVKRIGKSIEDEFGLSQKGCWWLLKGNAQLLDRKHSGFAPCMAATLRGYVRPSEADRIIAANYPALSPAQRRNLLEALRTNGLIEEDVVWYTSKSGPKSRIVFRLPYQRFSDHLIARHLLKSYLDVSSAAAIKQSFASRSPLARIFKVPKGYLREYAEPGWAQAIITEFPERVGKRLSPKERELFFVLPRRCQSLSAYFEPFIEGVFWRNPAAFTEGTRRVINQYLNSSARTREQTMDALAAVSTKPNHPYHARRLYDFLAQRTMPDRDLTWSEYLRRKYASPTIYRLLTWAKKLNTASMTEQSAKQLVVLFSLVFTTVVRRDRDLATKALVLIGEKFPAALFDHVIYSLSFNDPYLSERMLAAAYGVTMSLVDSEVAPTFRPLLGSLAENLYREMFEPDARFASHHALKRDYALGIIEIAQGSGCVDLPETASLNLNIPYPQIPSTFASDGTPDADVTEAIGHAIQMDFGNYTMGRLIPSRRKYDYEHSEYIKVRAKIERRIFDLGYRKELFENLEREIGSSFSRQDEHKVDRYGKKYSWIAYFEMWGEREAKRTLPDWRLEERTSDCDIDPSFPKRPPHWEPPIPDLFGDLNIDTEAWVESRFTPAWEQLLVVPEINGHQGDWVLLDGYVCGENTDHNREISAFLTGLFVARRDVQKLQSEFMSIEYPGNSSVPEADKETYLFAGEAGRRANYMRHLLQRNGRYRRQTKEAFDRYVAIPRGHRIPGVRVELPSIDFEWESYHSSLNDFTGFTLPAPSLIQRLGLKSKNREIDFYDSTGRPGILYRESGNRWKGNRHSLLYIRADLLRRYLSETRQALVWCNWGERDWLETMDGFELIENPARQRIYQAYRHIHRSFSQWRA